MWFGLIPDEPEVPLNIHAPVICVWKAGGERKEKKCNDLKSARAYAALYGGQPYWSYKEQTRNITPNGEVLRDWFDY